MNKVLIIGLFIALSGFMSGCSDDKYESVKVDDELVIPAGTIIEGVLVKEVNNMRMLVNVPEMGRTKVEKCHFEGSSQISESMNRVFVDFTSLICATKNKASLTKTNAYVVEEKTRIVGLPIECNTNEGCKIKLGTEANVIVTEATSLQGFEINVAEGSKGFDFRFNPID